MQGDPPNNDTKFNVEITTNLIFLCYIVLVISNNILKFYTKNNFMHYLDFKILIILIFNYL